MASERDKMLSGEPYRASAPALLAARLEARRLTQRLAEIDPGDRDARAALLRSLLGALGGSVVTHSIARGVVAAGNPCRPLR